MRTTTGLVAWSPHWTRIVAKQIGLNEEDGWTYEVVEVHTTTTYAIEINDENGEFISNW